MISGLILRTFRSLLWLLGAFVVFGLLSFVLGALVAFGTVFGQLAFVPRVCVVFQPLIFIPGAQVAFGSVFEPLTFVIVGSGGSRGIWGQVCDEISPSRGAGCQ